MKKTKLLSVFLIILGLLLLLSAASLAVYNLWDDSRAATASQNVLVKLEEAREEIRKQEASSQPEIDYTEAPSEAELPDYVLDPYMEMPTITVDGYRYVGSVVIPPLEIELPVTEEWDYDRMKIAPCRYSGSVYLDNLVICGHNYNSQFKKLDKLQINDTVIFIDAKGNTFQYSVETIDTLSATAVKEMTSGDWDLTLFTCNYSGRARVTVRCRKVDN